jgi:hypothetical protein
LYEKDTINLKINNFKNGEVTGDLEMKIENMPTKLAKLWENFVVIHYFELYLIQGANEKDTKPNGFLKNGNELILGNGKIEFH